MFMHIAAIAVEEGGTQSYRTELLFPARWHSSVAVVSTVATRDFPGR